MIKKLFFLAVIVGVSVYLIRTPSFWNSLSPIFHKDLLYKYAGEYKIDPLLIASIIKAESKFNPIATSKVGAVGLMQIMPETASELAKELKIDYLNVEELYKPELNIRIGFAYIAKLHREFNGNTIFALAAYNAGIKNARKWAKSYKGEDEVENINNIAFPETKEFVKKVLKTYRNFRFIRRIKLLLN